jgi:hypothetical protein
LSIQWFCAYTFYYLYSSFPWIVGQDLCLTLILPSSWSHYLFHKLVRVSQL